MPAVVSVLANDAEKAFDVVAQLLRRDGRVLDERDRLGVVLHRHRQAERRFAQAPDARLLAQVESRGGSDSPDLRARRSCFERVQGAAAGLRLRSS